MADQQYYVKSSEEDFYTKTLRGHKKVNFQSIENMIKTRTIKPNTKSFGRKMRLSTTIIHKNYLKTYRPQGIIFQTMAKPAYVMPFDLVLLSDTEKIIVHYYRIKKNLHMYYNHNLIKGFERFIFKDFKSLLRAFPTPLYAWKAVNAFRVSRGFKKLSKQKYRLVLYNEAVFNSPIKIKPIAIFGYRKKARIISKRYSLPHFISAKKFYQSLKTKAVKVRSDTITRTRQF